MPKQIAQTGIVSNPMHQFASWSYCWSLWWLDVTDYNALMGQDDIISAMSWQPGSSSWVIAEDSGLYPNRRFSGSLPLNYNIQTVDFETTVALNDVTRSSNLIDGSITVVEPYGVTFIDQLVAMSYNPNSGKYENYTEQPLMLQCDFKGWDDNGNPVPDSQVAVYRKRFPIKITNVGVEVDKGGATYKIDYVALGNSAHDTEYATIPVQITVTAGTVDEFFNGANGFVTQLNAFYLAEVPTAAYFADQYAFNIDHDIANSTIVDPKQTTLTNADPSSGLINTAKQTFKFAAKTAIIDIIDNILAHSSYFTKSQNININTASNSTSANGDGTSILSLYRTTTKVEFQGANGQDVYDNAFDPLRQHRCKLTTYNIHQYPSWDGKHPSTNTSLADSGPYTIKNYNYLYTGQNIDIIDFKLSFDTTYYTTIMAYQSAVASTNVSGDTGTDITQNNTPVIAINPAIVISAPNLTPYRYRAQKVNKNLTAGGNKESHIDSIVVADVIKSVYSNLSGGDMVNLDLTIVGDPTLIRQDDWYYSIDPGAFNDYTNWDSVSQAAFVKKYGHLRFDTGELVVTVTVNTPIDIDDGAYNDTGLMYPQMDGTNTYTSLFSGQYKVVTIKNSFANGKFEQTLTLVRYMQTDILKSFGAPVQRLGQTNTTSAVQSSYSNQQSIAAVNGGKDTYRIKQ